MIQFGVILISTQNEIQGEKKGANNSTIKEKDWTFQLHDTDRAQTGSPERSQKRQRNHRKKLDQAILETQAVLQQFET